MSDTDRIENITDAVVELRGIAQRLDVAVARQEEIVKAKPCEAHQAELKEIRGEIANERRWRQGLFFGAILACVGWLLSWIKH